MADIDYDGRIFRSVSSATEGDVDADTQFFYRQHGGVVSGEYSEGGVRSGVLIATVADDGALDMRYAHVASDGRMMTGTCRSTLEILADGRYRLHEAWEWTGGGEGSGVSIVEEVPPERA